MSLKKIIDKTIEYGFYTLFFTAPLIFNPSRILSSFELFEWNKMIFVYFMTILIISAWIGKMILHRRFFIKRTPFDIPILLFFVSQFLATIFSIDRHVSIFGYYSRFYGGLLSILAYLLLYFSYSANSEIINLKKLLLMSLSSGTVVAIYGILERYGIDAHMWVQDVQARVFSTLGQPNWLAAYIVILLPLAVSFSLTNLNKITSAKNVKLQIKNYFFIFYYLLLITLFYLCLLFTKSRSGLLGFWIANAVFWIIYFLKSTKDLKRSFFLFLIPNFLFLLLNFFVRTPFPLYNRLMTLDLFMPQALEIAKPPVGGSVIEIGITDSADIRRIVWKGAVEITKHYPLFGTGPETFAYSYYRYRPKEHNLTSEWDFLYNRAHNEFLNIAATSGFLGLSTYILLIATVLFWTIRHILQTPLSKYQLALTAGFTSILVTNFFGFSVVVIGLYFFLIPAFIFSQFTTPKVIEKNFRFNQLAAKIVMVSVCLLSIYLFITLVKFWFADSYYSRANSYKQQENYQEAYGAINKAISLRSDEPVYHDERASVAASLTMIAFESNEATLASQLAKDAIKESSQALKISPQNVNFWKTRTRILYQLAEFDEVFLDEALTSITIASQLAPTDAKIMYNVAVLYGRMDKDPEAIDALNKTVLLKPDYRDAYVALSIFYEKEKQFDKAREILNQALERINPNDEEIKTRLESIGWNTQ